MPKPKVFIPVMVKVRVMVDPDAWNAEYGSDESIADIRGAVKGMVVEGAEITLAHLMGPEETDPAVRSVGAAS